MGKQIKMKAPKGTRSAFIEGHDYEVPKDGIIKVAVEAHVETLTRHGFTFFTDKVTDEEIDEMDREALTTLIEEHGEDVEGSPKLKVLRAQAKELVAAAKAKEA